MAEAAAAYRQLMGLIDPRAQREREQEMEGEEVGYSLLEEVVVPIDFAVVLRNLAEVGDLMGSVSKLMMK